MSASDQRQQIIFENIPKLIENLTHFERKEENYKRCEEFANYILKNHRYLSVNSHEVKRKIEGMHEKFRVNNYKVYGDHLQKLIDGIINHPLCKKHYEVDVGWSMIDFLFNLSYNPVGALRENRDKISLEIRKDYDEEQNKEQQYWVDILKEDLIPVDHIQHARSSDSELSEWSDSDTELSSHSKSVESTSKTEEVIKFKSPIEIIPGVQLKPPEKAKNYVLFNGNKNKNWLFQNCQNSWWTNFKSEYQINSNLENANFAQLWNRYIAESSNNFIKLEIISTESEYRLMREILWMLYCPQTCKFFLVDESGHILVRKNVTIPSVTVDGLKLFLQFSFIPTMQRQLNLRTFIKLIYSHKSNLPPKTYECYASCLSDLLEPFYEKILQIEQYVKDQLPASIVTIIQIRNQLDKVFDYLEKIYKIHEKVILDFNKYPAHIASAHLLSCLLNAFRVSHDLETSNLAITLFMYSCRTFCDIMNTLWSEGILDDWRKEFVVEKYNDEKENLSVRLFEKCKELSFYVPKNISDLIKESAFIKLIINHAIEAGYTLNFLYEIDKISYLRSASNFDDNLFDHFFNDVMSSVKNFKIAINEITKETNILGSSLSNINLNQEDACSSNCDEDKSVMNKSNILSKETCKAICQYELEKNDQDDGANLAEKLSNRNFLAQCAPTTDEFLLMAFSCNFNLSSTEKKSESDCLDKFKKTYKLYEKLNDTSHITIPLEEIILSSISKILSYRISFTNSFVMKMYREDFKIGKHLQNIRQVLLLEAGDLMQFFYQKIFSDIENEKLWANPFTLTVQLDDILTAKFPELSLLFKVDINSAFKCKTTKVIDAVDEIIIAYNVRKELKNIITDEIMKYYNDVFHFLLKIKWSIWTLENLRFARVHKNRLPYATFRLIDLNMRQLEQLRLWMMYSLHCIQSHIMTAVLHAMGNQLDEKINNCANLAELKCIHKSYVKTIYEQCLLSSHFETVKAGVEQLFNLTYVVREQWKICVQNLDQNYYSDDELDGSQHNELVSQKDMIDDIKSIEGTYVKCHSYLAKSLNNEVYWNQKEFLTPLLAAFQSSLPC
ncbi:gamma-tubulin complex component 5 [Condylostylus longicornis]|uniref:gamma-tubulin complex component 5 n=1 Tax=Condylostylus longicornis TaxID=2530218 RepID=UPI00244DD706|nr:gamma-tubulin complex component 5 [Condylostylus longicornis]